MSERSADNGPTILKFMCDFFKCGPDEALYATATQASNERLGELLDRYREFASARRSTAPALQSGELRPYLPTDFNKATWALGGVQLEPHAVFTRQEGMWGAIDVLKHRLLYCHSVAIDHPLGELLLMASRDERYREHLGNFVQFLLHLRPLIETNALCLMSPGYYVKGARWSSEFGNQLTAFVGKGVGVPAPDLDEFEQRAPPDVREKWQTMLPTAAGREIIERATRRTSCARIDRVLAALGDEPDRVTAYLPFRYDAKLIAAFERSVVNLVSKSQRASELIPDGDNRLMNQFLDIELPKIELISPQDLVDIRQGDEFNKWRDDLRSALRHADTLPQDLLNRRKAAGQEVRERMRLAKEQLEKGYKQSSLLSRIRKGKTKLICGGVGLVVGALINPLATTAVLGAGLAAKSTEIIFELLAEHARNRPSSKRVQDAVLSHYVAMLD